MGQLQFIYLSRGPRIGGGVTEGNRRSRLGLIVSRKVGKAYQRNKIKRLVREVFRKERWRLNEPLDIAVRAVGPTATRLTYNEVTREFQRFVEAMTRRG